MFASLQHVKLSINVKIPVTIWQIVYIYIIMTAVSSNSISRIICTILRKLDLDTIQNALTYLES